MRGLKTLSENSTASWPVCTYWIYTLFYFPALLFASAAMAAYIGGIGYAPLAQNRTFLLVVSFLLFFVAVYMNIIGLRIGKWLQNAGAVGTFVHQRGPSLRRLLSGPGSAR